jgi:hypothetical protein
MDMNCKENHVAANKKNAIIVVVGDTAYIRLTWFERQSL